MNKRGVIYSARMMFKWTFLYSAYLLYILLSVIIIVQLFVIHDINVQKTESYVYAGRLFYHSGYLSDEPGVIKQEGYNLIGSEGSATVKGPIFNDKLVIIAARFFNNEDEAFDKHQQFEDWDILYDAGLTKGPGGVNEYTVTYGSVTVEVVTPNA